MTPPLLSRRARRSMQAAVAGALLLRFALPGFSQPPINYQVWETHRETVEHPAAAIKAVDVARAKQNIALYPSARDYLTSVQANADETLAKLSPEYLATMIEQTTPGCVGPCPGCRAKGLPWHPNGQWSWTEEKPDQLTCTVCRTVFPNTTFPETVVLQSTWDPRQKFSFAGGEPFNCFGYLARPSFTGIIRAQKLASAAARLNTLAIAYALSSAPKYARGAKTMLLRLAEVLPSYLVRAGYAYGEYADCDPRVAAERITHLPTDELVVPPNRPDRKLHAAYWAASRLGSSGMDGAWVSRVAQAYDLTCAAAENGAPVYSEAERRRIERDVLLESAYLAMCDPGINNKSVGNRAGAAMVGMSAGHPDLVSFGLEGFRRTVNDWFLPDGGTSESAAYALMTMGGIRNFGLMFRGYSDPAGYRNREGTRIDGFDASRDTRYGDCWQALIWTLQGDLRHPPIADSYRNTTINAGFAELITLCYPTDEHVALLKELSRDGAPAAPSEAIFQREPGVAARAAPPLSLPDVVFPSLSQGYLRTGHDGRRSVAVLNAADWGSHHHQDSLDLYYWSGGHELLSDLGYLWDHPDKHKTSRAFAHHLVLLDGQEQRTRERGGSFHLFATTPKVKVMEASSRAYAAASIYRRTVIQIDHGEAGSYLVDIFRTQGGDRRQFVLHGPTKDYAVEGVALTAASATAVELAHARTGSGATPWHATWRVSGDYQFTAWAPGAAGEQVTVGEGWGQRDHRNTDRGAVLPYLIRETRGSGLDQFVTVFEGAPVDRPLTRSVRRVALPVGSPADAVAVAVETVIGTDIIISMLTPSTLRVPTPWGELTCDGRAAAVLGTALQPRDAILIGGVRLEVAKLSLATTRASYAGKIVSAENGPGESWFVVEG
ncbi:MAG: hypothetical protein RIQ93_2080, partial [Verrucomicrobiota bacterium]